MRTGNTTTALAHPHHWPLGLRSGRVQWVESERLPTGLTGVLLALLAASLGGMGYLWRGRRGVQSHSGFGESDVAGRNVGRNDGRNAGRRHEPTDDHRYDRRDERWDGLRTPMAVQALAGRRGRAAGDACGAGFSLPSPPPEDEGLVEIGELEFDKLMASGRAYSGFRSGSLSRELSDRIHLKPKASAARLVNSETLMARRQQAGFLVSLGQAEQALNQLHAMAQSNALPTQPLAGDALVLDLDLTQATPKTEHTTGVPSWRVDFRNTAPGLIARSSPAASDRLPATAACNMIDFELPAWGGAD